MPHTFPRHKTRNGLRRATPDPTLNVTIRHTPPEASAGLRCRCGRVALRRVGARGYCATHAAEAWRAAKREAGHASADALLNWISGMNIEEEA